MIGYCRTILLASAVFGVGMPALPADLSSLPPPADRKIDFMADVDPIFVQHCYMCHGDEAVMNGYSLWRRKSAVRGGYSGEPAIETRDSANSRLIHLVAGLEENLLMPPTGGKLSDEQIGILRAWIDQGAPFASTRFNDSTRAQDQPWLHMDYGPVISASVTVREPDDPRADKEPGTNVSYKSHAIMLGEGRRAGVIFDTELLRMAAGWNGPQYVLTGTVYDWKHGPHPHLDGEPVFETPVAPGWARDETFSDPRQERFGPLPADWAKYKGRYMFGDKVVLRYSVGGTDVLEMPGMQSDWGVDALSRTFEVGPTREELLLEVAAAEGADARQLSLRRLTRGQGPAVDHLVHLGGGRGPAVGVAGIAKKARWDLAAPGEVRLRIPKSGEVQRFTVYYASLPAERLGSFAGALREAPRPERLEPYTRGGPRTYRKPVVTKGRLGSGPGPWTVDEISVPFENPWRSWFRPTDFAFFDDDRAAVATWSGDVWIVDGVDADLDELTWTRYAVGFHMPQGLEVVDGKVYVLDRDQVTVLHDLNQDGQADYYENFNNEFHVTHHFHEFTFDLDRDGEGNFYFAKAARHALPANVKHHGVIFKMDPKGQNLEVVCTGFRVPNGVAVGPNGEITTSDQEGHWIPSTRVNLCSPGSFHGYMWGGSIPEKDTYDDPITWLPISVDNSGAGQAWIGTDKWGPFKGHLVHSSFGRGKIFLVLMETVDGSVQGGAVELPVDFDTGLMRPDFREGDGNLYLAGLYGWGTKRKAVGGFYRVRHTGGKVLVPSELHVSKQGIDVSFLHELDPETAEDPANYLVKRWNYKWLSRYGSDRWRLDGEPGVEVMSVRGVRLLPDRKTVRIQVDDLRRVMQMMTSISIRTADGDRIETEISHSIHSLPEQPGTAFVAAYK